MSTSVGPLILPRQDYSIQNETQFRRDLQAQIENILSELRAVKSGSSPQGSLASKRENLLSVAIGVTEYF